MLAIQTLQAHTVHSDKRWIGHPSIPLWVFGPANYFDDPPKQLTKPKTAARPLFDDNRFIFDTQPSSLQPRDFQGTQYLHEKFFPKFKEHSLGWKFAIWFNHTFVDWSAELRQKAIQASQEAAT